MKEIKVRLTFTESVLGTAPQNEDVYTDYIASKAPDANTLEDEVATLGVDEVVEKGKTVFHKENGVPFLYDYQIRGFFKGACGFLRTVPGMLSKAKEAAEAEAGKLRASNTELNDKANRATAAEADANKYKAEKEAAEKKAADAAVKEREAQAALEKLKANPEIPEEKLKEISEAAEKTAKAEAAKAITEAEKRLAATADELKAAQSQLKMSNPDVAELKIYFVQFQESFNRMLGKLKQIQNKDAETAEKLKPAIFDALSKFNLSMPED